MTPREIANDLCVRATVIRLHDDAATLAELCVESKLPTLADATAREQVLLALLAEANARARLLLVMLAE